MMYYFLALVLALSACQYAPTPSFDDEINSKIDSIIHTLPSLHIFNIQEFRHRFQGKYEWMQYEIDFPCKKHFRGILVNEFHKKNAIVYKVDHSTSPNYNAYMMRLRIKTPLPFENQQNITMFVYEKNGKFKGSFSDFKVYRFYFQDDDTVVIFAVKNKNLITITLKSV